MENQKPSFEEVKSILKKVKPIYIVIGSILLITIIYFLFSGSSIRAENKRLKKEVESIQKNG
jgi:Na+/H+-translocating membrane pyrophosphatase